MRRLRLATGLVIACFVVPHFLNHALGVVSIEAMDQMRAALSAWWRSPPGTMLLYGALLLVVRREGGIFRDEETVMVNYRVQGNRYIVDTVFDRAILIAGVGGSQDRVTISRRK